MASVDGKSADVQPVGVVEVTCKSGDDRPIAVVERKSAELRPVASTDSKPIHRVPPAVVNNESVKDSITEEDQNRQIAEIKEKPDHEEKHLVIENSESSGIL